MVKYNLIIDNYNFEFADVYINKKEQQIRSSLFELNTNIPIKSLKDFIKKSLNHISYINTELEEYLLKEKIVEYISYYQTFSKKKSKNRILEKIGIYLIFCQNLRNCLWTKIFLNKIDSYHMVSKLELSILKLINRKLKKITNTIIYPKEDTKINLEIEFNMLDIIYDNTGIYNQENSEYFDIFLE